MMKSIHCSGLVLVGILLFCGGCRSPISYVAPGDPVAVLENVHMQGTTKHADAALFIMVRYVDGRGPAHLKVRGYNRRAWAIELPPGHHSLDVRVTQITRKQPKGDRSMNQPLTIELEARAGHNYRVCAYAYGANTVSLYIEDIITGEVVSGHRPEKPVSP